MDYWGEEILPNNLFRGKSSSRMDWERGKQRILLRARVRVLINLQIQE